MSEKAFLERAIITNPFSEFGIARENFTTILKKVELERVPRAIAGWLRTTISNIYCRTKK